MSKKIEFFAELVNILYQLKNKDPEYSKFIPRVLSNPIFDYTQGKDYSIGDIYHKDGNALKKLNIEWTVEEKKKEILVIKEGIESYQESIKDLLKLRPKKEYIGDIRNLRNQILSMGLSIKKIEEEIRDIRKGKTGLTCKWLVEHVYGRDFASKRILEIMDERGSSITPEEAEALLKKLAITIRVEVYVDADGNQWHTKLNKNLEEIQKGNTSWEGYKKHAEDCGYIGFDEISKDHFNLGDK